MIKQLTHINFINYYKEAINAVNFFPIPDSDTGNNITVTLNPLIFEYRKNKIKSLKDFCEITHEILINNAIGNSGIILRK